MIGFKGRYFSKDIIFMAVRRKLAYPLSYGGITAKVIIKKWLALLILTGMEKHRSGLSQPWRRRKCC